MNFLKNSRLFGLSVVPVLIAGLFFVLQTNMDRNTTDNIQPNTITPGDQGSGFPSIVPSDRDTTKIEYRNILFRQGSNDKVFGSEASSAALPQSDSVSL